VSENVKIDLEKFARSRWGTDAEYYAELERFHKEHSRADAIEYCNETRMPVQAIYYFRPYTVVRDHFSLMDKIREANKEAPHE
jgi:hypothetical protein